MGGRGEQRGREKEEGAWWSLAQTRESLLPPSDNLRPKTEEPSPPHVRRSASVRRRPWSPPNSTAAMVAFLLAFRSSRLNPSISMMVMTMIVIILTIVIVTTAAAAATTTTTAAAAATTTTSILFTIIITNAPRCRARSPSALQRIRISSSDFLAVLRAQQHGAGDDDGPPPP